MGTCRLGTICTPDKQPLTNFVPPHKPEFPGQSENQQMDKRDLLDFLSLNLAKTANWRRSQATRWPADPRNAAAADRLFALASQADAIPDDLWQAIGPSFDPRDERFCQLVSDASRAVGFRSNPRNFGAYVQNVADALVVA